ncbi:MAG: vitamin B12 dependent methionine synthase [Deltaproteobacteria bacterium]|nr:vitamin B12 dependent methionine synthase [Deltaproteobacteria bacterium]
MTERLDHIPVHLDMDQLRQKLRISDLTRIDPLLDVVYSLIEPRGVYRVSYIDDMYGDKVIIDGISFKSQVLFKNLGDTRRVFPYALTVGDQLEKALPEYKNFPEKFYLDAISNLALGETRKYLEDHLKKKFAIERMSFMSPGSLDDWPLAEQKSLFALLGDATGEIGVSLSETFLMTPRKSISGLYFSTETTFFNCQLCPRKACVGRKAPYSDDLARQYGILK